MPERAPLDLGRIVAQYEPLTAVRPEPPVLSYDDDKDPLRFSVPTKLGKGPLAWSTCTALLPVENPCHDVNGYYRELGVHWRATRKELLEAYQAKGGQSSPRLTYVFKQLLNPRVRRAYDLMPEGSVFDDDYTDEKIKHDAHRESAARRLKGVDVSAEKILDEWGYVLEDESELDSVTPIGKDHSTQPDEPWPFSYYAWKTSTYTPDQARLRRWQELLATAASARGRSPKMILGTTSLSDQPFMLENINGSPVVFFSEGTAPTLSVAADAIDRSLNYAPA